MNNSLEKQLKESQSSSFGQSREGSKEQILEEQAKVEQYRK